MDQVFMGGRDKPGHDEFLLGSSAAVTPPPSFNPR